MPIFWKFVGKNVHHYGKAQCEPRSDVVQVDVPKNRILLGLKGSSSSRDIMKLAREAVRQDLLGVMIWYCSVQSGLKYAPTWDCTGREDSMAGYVEAMDYLNNNL